MTDETDTTSEVARVLAETARCTWSIPDPEHPHGDACRHRRHDRGHGACWDVAYRQAAMLAEAGLLRDDRRLLPDPTGGCVCSFESEDRGAGHSELVQEYEPACPVHSEHVYDPIQGLWVFRGEVPKNPTKPVDPWAERLECPRCCPEPCCDHRNTEYGNCTDCHNTGHNHAWCPDHEAQIAAPVPAEQPAAGSAGRGESGGVGGACGSAYALGHPYDPDAECGVCGGTRDRAEMWRREANRMDYALRALADDLDADLIGIESTQRAAQRIRDAIDGPKPETNENEGDA